MLSGLTLTTTCTPDLLPQQSIEKPYLLHDLGYDSMGCDYGPFDYPAEYIKRSKGLHHKTFARRI